MSYELLASRNSSVIGSWTLYREHEQEKAHGERAKWCGKLKC